MNYLFIYGWRTRKMKTKLLVILCVMILAGACMVGPVAAVTDTSTITGNITPYISLEVTTDTIAGWAFVTGVNTNTTDVRLQLVCNYPQWTITAADALNTDGNAKPSESRGKMAQSDVDGHYVISDPHFYLHNNLGITGQSVSNQYTAAGGSRLLTDDGSPLQIYTGENHPSGTGTFSNMRSDISQEIVVADSVLPADNLYKIIVTFTALVP